VPVVVYVNAEEEKGSIISGEEGEAETDGGGYSCGVELNGCEERSRIAWVIVG
jgi:hypothetical protein